MGKQNKSPLPNETEYTIKYIFKEDSIVDINEVIKECFIMKLQNTKNKKITQ